MIFVAFAIIVGALVISNSKRTPYKVYKAKQCPPHRWYWEEIRDHTGELQGERMMCKDCGPFSDLFDRKE